METYLVHQLHDGRFVLLGVQGAYATRAAVFEGVPDAEAFAAWSEDVTDLRRDTADATEDAEDAEDNGRYGRCRSDYADGYEQAVFDLENRAHENGNSALAKEIAEMGDALLREQREEEEDAEEPACYNCYYTHKGSDEEPCKSCSHAHVLHYRPAKCGDGIEDTPNYTPDQAEEMERRAKDCPFRPQPPDEPCPNWTPKVSFHSEGVDLIAAERRRQVLEEGWTAEHDRQWTEDELPRAAACYALAYVPQSDSLRERLRAVWPWDTPWWKPKTHFANLVRAGALIAAKLDRMAKAEAKPPTRHYSSDATIGEAIREESEEAAKEVTSNA